MSSFKPSSILLLAFFALNACDDDPSQPVEPPQSAVPTERAEPTEAEMVALMEGHYNSAIAGHDALIRGDIETFKRRIGELEGQDLPESAPESWQSHEQVLHEASRRVSVASDLDSAGLAMGAVVQACGSCHVAVGLGEIYRHPAAPEGESPLETAMLSHQWASERLWEGVTGPKEDSWSRGAAALAESRVFTTEGEPVTSSLQAREEQMRELGRVAQTTDGLSARSEVYGRLLASCGACHAEAGTSLD